MGSFSLLPSSTFVASRAPIADTNGFATRGFLQLLILWDTILRNAFNQTGQIIISEIPDVPITGRTEPIGTTLQYIDSGGMILGPGIDFARPYINKDTNHIADGTGSPLAGGKVAYAAFVASGPVAGQTIEYNGTDWLPVAIAVTKAGVTSQWVRSYDAATGTFSASQPNFTDILGTATPGQLPANTVVLASSSASGQTPRYNGTNWLPVFIAQTKTAIPSQWLNSYDAATGTFTSTQPVVADVAGAAPLASPTFTGTVTTPALADTGLTSGNIVQAAGGGLLTSGIASNLIAQGFLGNTASATPTRIVTGFNTLAAGTLTVTFTSPMSSLEAVVCMPVSGNAPGAATPTLWIATGSGVSFTVRSSSATDTNSFFWIAVGKP